MQGLYLITDQAGLRAANFLQRVEAAFLGGARFLQYRNKNDNDNARRQQAGALVQLCSRYDVPVIINDDVQLAHETGAAGVHLGRDDADIAEARALLGTPAIIGVSCYNELNRALAAEAVGANYVAFGSFYPSATKPYALRAHVDLLRLAKKKLHIPIAAIGGITPENGAILIAAGADMLAVIDAVFGQADPMRAAQAFAKLF
ncbi:MAG TPA: thiamine phosphate synthase [Acidiferrobacterales bacterium]|nr:thiamine phosphate synthase [Acidiferrobacterales bacterium]